MESDKSRNARKALQEQRERTARAAQQNEIQEQILAVLPEDLDISYVHVNLYGGMHTISLEFERDYLEDALPLWDLFPDIPALLYRSGSFVSFGPDMEVPPKTYRAKDTTVTVVSPFEIVMQHGNNGYKNILLQWYTVLEEMTARVSVQVKNWPLYTEYAEEWKIQFGKRVEIEHRLYKCRFQHMSEIVRYGSDFDTTHLYWPGHVDLGYILGELLEEKGTRVELSLSKRRY